VKNPKARIHNYPGIPGHDALPVDENAGGHRPELALFSMAMFGGGRVTTRSHLEGQSYALFIKTTPYLQILF
jgi:hypothetical protein